MIKLKNLFVAALVCAVLALSLNAGAQASELQSPESFQIATATPAVQFAPLQTTGDDIMTLAEFRELKKKYLKDPTNPGGGGGNRPATDFKGNPGGFLEFDACCDNCSKPGGCTGCNSGPKGLNCGKGLIAADCQVVNDKVTCVQKDD